MYARKTSTGLWLFAGLLTTLFYACKKNDKLAYPDPDITLSVAQDTVVYLADSIIIQAVVGNGAVVSHSWTVNDSLYSNTARLAFKAPAGGIYEVKYTGEHSQWVLRKTITVDVWAAIKPITDKSSKLISVVYAYLPAPGQFINESIGIPSGVKEIIGKIDSGMVSLGGFGGYIIFGFDHSIINKAGADLAINGNPLKPPSEWSEPGIVMVSQDINENGIPDDPWYELAGSEYNAATTIKNYRVTYYNPKMKANVPWKDSRGDSGAVELNRWHNHEYYPLFAENQDSLTFEGTVMKNTFGLMPGSSLYINTGFPWGYVDNWGTDPQKDPYETNRYNSFDLSWAVDKDGKPVTLRAIDFVKVYTGQNCKGNTVLGEISTEITGAMDLNMVK